MIILRQNVGLPPGGIQFRDPRVSEKFWNDCSAFLDDRITEVIKFRQQNPEIYDQKLDRDADFFDREKVSQEITMFNYTRLNGDPNHFIEANGRRIPGTFNPVLGKCNCGMELVPRYCSTCVGKKVIGYKCPTCGRLYEL